MAEKHYRRLCVLMHTGREARRGMRQQEESKELQVGDCFE
jgi:hypothetical protein